MERLTTDLDRDSSASPSYVAQASAGVCSDDTPIVFNINTGAIKIQDWALQHRQQVLELLQRHGAVLLRGLKVNSSKKFSEVLTNLFDSELLEYRYRSTPRTGMKGNVYTATEYSCDEVIQQHNENAYSDSWPDYLGFLCLIEPEQGGRTPICDSREIYRQLPREIVSAFEEKGVMYVRNYGDVDLPWQEVFQTTEKQDVEAYCQAHSLRFIWLPGDRLRTIQVNPAVQIHPQTQERIWFNQAHLFHVSSFAQAEQDALLQSYGEKGLPRNAYFGDGSPIPLEYLQQIRQTYERNLRSFDWQKNDLLLLDNLKFTHGREPFVGNRKILVGMVKPSADLNRTN
ncbi:MULTISPECIES: TauD/TfdA family dioxygenase [unclassified Pseudoalteromonas]|uniref:TauD/TfdA family dioxygenase n=1 Tax=unclassified Pseudoalteromonas TaxID=194690 RepID=UPI0003F61782|nr:MULTISPECIES: TauD/TfdA family dioxygenase [unclassified Pseudoalteromonas]PCC14205.1 taurine catabolism dioxygenase TauD [Pseudoalteromonas sp. JB197]SJN16485.1 SyrP-like protein [Pseudoalteromonas sp. JB197]